MNVCFKCVHVTLGYTVGNLPHNRAHKQLIVICFLVFWVMGMGRGELWSEQRWGLYFRSEIFAVTALWNFCGNTSFLFPISIRCPQSTIDKAEWGGDVITFETWAMCVSATASVCDCIQCVCVCVLYCTTVQLWYWSIFDFGRTLNFFCTTFH